MRTIEGLAVAKTTQGRSLHAYAQPLSMSRRVRIKNRRPRSDRRSLRSVSQRLKESASNWDIRDESGKRGATHEVASSQKRTPILADRRSFRGPKGHGCPRIGAFNKGQQTRRRQMTIGLNPAQKQADLRRNQNSRVFDRYGRQNFEARLLKLKFWTGSRQVEARDLSLPIRHEREESQLTPGVFFIEVENHLLEGRWHEAARVKLGAIWTCRDIADDPRRLLRTGSSHVAG